MAKKIEQKKNDISWECENYSGSIIFTIIMEKSSTTFELSRDQAKEFAISILGSLK